MFFFLFDVDFFLAATDVFALDFFAACTSVAANPANVIINADKIYKMLLNFIQYNLAIVGLHFTIGY